MNELIERQAAIDAAEKIIERDTSGNNAVVNAMIAWSEYIRALPPAQPEPSIPVAWIERKIEWLNNMDNYFAELTANIIKTMLNEWRKGQTDNVD